VTQAPLPRARAVQGEALDDYVAKLEKAKVVLDPSGARRSSSPAKNSPSRKVLSWWRMPGCRPRSLAWWNGRSC